QELQRGGAENAEDAEESQELDRAGFAFALLCDLCVLRASALNALLRMNGRGGMDLSYIINVLGEERERYKGAVATPVWQTSIFAFESVARMREVFSDEYGNTVYTRGNNPTVEILRKK